MTERPLPPPVTAEEMYLAAILDELRALNRRPQSREDGTIELREPTAKTANNPPQQRNLVKGQ